MRRSSAWRKAWLGFGLLVLATTVPAAEPAPQLVIPEGGSVGWHAWLEERGQSAVLIWSSWAPRAFEPLGALPELRKACAAKNLELVLIAVQEPIEDARKALQPYRVTWLHDRRGDILKHHRVTRLPALLVVDEAGEVLARLTPDPSQIDGWSGP